MTPEPRHPPIVPSYGASALADPVVVDARVPSTRGAPESQNVLGLTPDAACVPAESWTGLGWELLP